MICAPEHSAELFRKAQKIRAIVTDVDGVLTNRQIVFTDSGEQLKFFDGLDGFAMKMARAAGLTTGIISASGSEAIRHRARVLGFDAVFIGSYEKLIAFETFKNQFELADNEICFLGDDVPDLPLLLRAGLGVAVNDASDDALSACHFRTKRNGGDGALREVVEYILFAQNRREKIIEHLLQTFGG